MLTAFSPAKINLFLRVLGKRQDGYHELSTVMQTISLGDILYFKVAENDHLSCTNRSIPLDESNLILKAVRLFRQKTGIATQLAIHVDKQIPVQAGLGGGSSNAATTLWAFNELTGRTVSQEILQEWSAEIGSDVPFFFSSGTAYCQGRGEKVVSLPAQLSAKCYIVKPHTGLSTPLIYQQLRADPLRNVICNELDGFLSGTLNYFNDLEKPAFEVYPTLSQLKAQLATKFKTVLMTGSGSAFFCLGEANDTLSNLDVVSYQAYFLNRNSINWYQIHNECNIG